MRLARLSGPGVLVAAWPVVVQRARARELFLPEQRQEPGFLPVPVGAVSVQDWGPGPGLAPVLVRMPLRAQPHQQEPRLPRVSPLAWAGGLRVRSMEPLNACPASVCKIVSKPT